MHYFISDTLFYVFNTSFRYKQASFGHFAIVANDCHFWLNIGMSSQLICDVTRTRGTSIVTSYLLIVLALANWCIGDLHKRITTVNIDISPPGIHGLACKNVCIKRHKQLKVSLFYCLISKYQVRSNVWLYVMTKVAIKMHSDPLIHISHSQNKNNSSFRS